MLLSFYLEVGERSSKVPQTAILFVGSTTYMLSSLQFCLQFCLLNVRVVRIENFFSLEKENILYYWIFKCFFFSLYD